MARMQPPGDHPRGQRLVWTNRKRDRELQLRLFQFEGFSPVFLAQLAKH